MKTVRITASVFDGVKTYDGTPETPIVAELQDDFAGRVVSRGCGEFVDGEAVQITASDVAVVSASELVGEKE